MQIGINRTAAIFGLWAAVIVAPQAEASCVRVQEEGKWANIESASSIIDTLVITSICKDTILNDEYVHQGSGWYVEVTGNCGRQECNWGRGGAEQIRYHYKPQFDGEASFRVYPIFVSFDRAGVRYHLYIHMSPREEGVLNVRVYTGKLDSWKATAVEDLKFRPQFGAELEGMKITLERTDKPQR